jgi:hypothetical protein
MGVRAAAVTFDTVGWTGLSTGLADWFRFGCAVVTVSSGSSGTEGTGWRRVRCWAGWNCPADDGLREDWFDSTGL